MSGTLEQLKEVLQMAKLENFDIDKFVNFPLNDGDRFYDSDGCGCAKGCLDQALGGLIGDYARAIEKWTCYAKNPIIYYIDGTQLLMTVMVSPKNIRNSDLTLANIADRAECILMGRPFANASDSMVTPKSSARRYAVYPREQRKLKTKEFLLRALRKFGYIELADAQKASKQLVAAQVG
jgi:hypothetical protein